MEKVKLEKRRLAEEAHRGEQEAIAEKKRAEKEAAEQAEQAAKAKALEDAEKARVAGLESAKKLEGLTPRSAAAKLRTSRRRRSRRRCETWERCFVAQNGRAGSEGRGAFYGGAGLFC